MPLVLVSACGGSESDDDFGGVAGQLETNVVRLDVEASVAGFDVAVGENTGWLLISGDPAEIWEVGSDGTLTRRAELADGADEITAFGDGLAVTRFRCTDPADEECGAPVAELLLIGPDGSIDHELTLANSDSGSLEGVGMRVIGSSDEHIWVETSTDSVQVVAVSRSGNVETIPLARDRPFANDQSCVVGGELMTVRVHTDLYDPVQGPSDTGVVVTPETAIRTTVSVESFADGEWRPVAGSERTFELRGAEASAVCDETSVVVEGADSGAESRSQARWTPDDGWVAHPPGPQPPAPPGSLGVNGCAECVWGRDGEVLRRRDDGAFQTTGLMVVDPDGADDSPEVTEVELGSLGAIVACASFPDDGPGPSVEPTAPSTTVTVAALAASRSRASQQEGNLLVCDLAPV
jgi:hypothetical protein